MNVSDVLASIDAVLEEADTPAEPPAPDPTAAPDEAPEPLEDAPEPQQEAPEPREIPEPRGPATVPAQADKLRIGDRMPDWWAPKPVIVAEEDAEPPTGPVETTEPVEKVTPDDDQDDEGDEDEDEEKPATPSKPRRRWLHGSGKKTYSRPTYGSTPEAKQSLMGWWTGRSAQSRWLLYNGTALAAGFALGVPQFFTAEVAYLDATYDSWTDFYVCVWYGVAVGIWAFDYRTRNWLPPFALACRIPLVSMVVGALLYGSPVTP